MSDALAQIVRNTIVAYGEPIEITPKISGMTSYVRASVQTPTQDALVNDLDQSGFTVYVSPLDLVDRPLKFDRVKIRGVVTALEEDAKLETISGVSVVYVLRTLG